MVAAVRATGSAAARTGAEAIAPGAVFGPRLDVRRLAERSRTSPCGTLPAELAERRIKVSYYVVWHFFEYEGISLKKPA